MKQCKRPFIVCKRGSRDKRFATLPEAQAYKKNTTSIYDVGDIYIVRCLNGKRVVINESDKVVSENVTRKGDKV